MMKAKQYIRENKVGKLNLINFFSFQCVVG